MTTPHEAMRQDALDGLCYNDPRSTYYRQPDDDEPPAAYAMCHCDSCFYGRHKLALHVLALLEESK